jgi:stage V sporulation protein R
MAVSISTSATRIATVEELQEACARIWDVAWGMGLRPFPMHYEIVPSTILYEFGAYGLPGRFSHWTHGKAYHQMKTMYDYGLSKIYELVINTNPCYAFLLDTNGFVQNKMIIAHVLAHSDFFANNAWYARTSRRMMETVSVNANRMRQYEFEYGKEAVEAVLDAVLAIQEHVEDGVTGYKRRPLYDDDGRPERKKPEPHKDGPYDDVWRERAPDDPLLPVAGRPTGDPARDLLLFIAQHSPALEEWQQDIVQIIRGEMLYFLPQMQTKICNEGWASYWHVRIMRELNLTDEEVIAFADLHAGVLQPSPRRINPYYVGYKALEDIERRWSEGGKEPEKGREKLFEVREVENDASLLRNYLTRELCEDLDLYQYGKQGDDVVVTETNWEEVRDALVAEVTTHGRPLIVADDGDYRGNRELYLRHAWEGRDLDVQYAEKVLEYVHRLWGRTVHLETHNGGNQMLLSYDATDGHRRRT